MIYSIKYNQSIILYPCTWTSTPLVCILYAGTHHLFGISLGFDPGRTHDINEWLQRLSWPARVNGAATTGAQLRGRLHVRSEPGTLRLHLRWRLPDCRFPESGKWSFKVLKATISRSFYMKFITSIASRGLGVKYLKINVLLVWGHFHETISVMSGDL